MAIALSSNIEYRKDDRERYRDLNNIIDITKDDLKSLKSAATETDLDSHIAEINKVVENQFDGMLGNQRESTISLMIDGVKTEKTVKDIVMSGKQNELDALAKYAVEQSGYLQEIAKIEDKEIQAALKSYTFKLNDLWKSIQTSTQGAEGSVGDSNVLLSDRGEGINGNEIFEVKSLYVDPFRDTEYASFGKDDNIENIYSDKKLRNVMERIFDNEQKDELHKRTFNINLGKEAGLAGIIIAIRTAAEYKDKELEESDPNYKYKQIGELFSINEDGSLDLGNDKKSTKKALNKLIDAGILTYKRDGGRDSEVGKIAKILTTAQRKDLDTFAALVESKSDVEMAVKEWNNSLEITGNSREDKERKHNKNYKEKSSKVNPGNVLSFLCDINGDGAIALNKKENQGDVGTVFGQQLLFTLEQAIAVQDIEHPGKGEQIVIENILKNMRITDRRSLTKEQTKLLDGMVSDGTKCTKENLSKLIVGYEDADGNHVDGMPEFKSFFLDAITTINGGSTEVQPDLYETLVGDDAKAIIEAKETKTEAKIAIDTWLKEVKGLDDPAQAELRQLIKEQGVVRVRETIFIKLMTTLDNATITTNNGARTQIQAAGITKGRAARNAHKEMLETTVNKLINGGIHYSAQGGLRLTLGINESGISKSGRTQRSRGADAGIIGGPQGVELYVGVSGEIAEQYNHGTVINADLSQVRSAKYLGLEGQAVAAIGITNGLGVEVSGGINWKKDYIVGINQINEQYASLSQEIFNIEDMSAETLLDKNLFKSHIKDKITNFSGGKYAKFVEKNTQHLLNNLETIVGYMDANKFFGPEGKIALLPEDKKTSAITTLLDIMQSGNIETRRHDVVAGLHGKIDITKLSFGVTSNILTFKLPKSTKHAPSASATAGETTEAGNIASGGTESEVDLGQERFGIFGFYVGARLSTWKNKYVPNEQQYLYTQYEMGKGIGAEHIETKDGNLQKYAKYLTALYNVYPKGKLSCTIQEGKLVIKLNTKEAYPKLQDFLNIHTTPEAEKNFSLKNNILTIGNVGEIGAYTVTEAKGISRVLCLGSKQLDAAHRVSQDTDGTTVAAIENKINGKKEWPKEKIESKIITTMKGADNNEATPEIKRATAAFFDKEGKLVTPEGMTTTFEGCSETQKLTIGTLTIIKTADNAYTLKLDAATSTDKLTIKYRDQKVYDEAVKTAQANPENYTTTTLPIDNLFAPEIGSEVSNAQKLLNKLSNSIKDLEKSNKKAYYKFLTDASNILDGDGAINDTELGKAIDQLKILLPSNTDDLTQLRTYLDSNDWDTKTYIVDRLKQIFAKDSYYENKTLGKILQLHSYGNKRETLTGPSGNKLPKALLQELKLQRKDRAKSTENYNENPKPNSNLLGYTGFYRYAAGEQYRNQKFSMTSLGNTSSQVEPYVITKNAEAATTWFLNNLEKNTFEVNYLATQLEKKIAANGATVSLRKSTDAETFELLQQLLKGEEITLDSGTKISININPVFYLLGECANESLGMEINAITIKKLKDNIPLAGEYTGNGTADNNYVTGIDIWGKSHSIASHVSSQEVSLGRNHHRNKNTPPRADATAGQTDKSSSGGTEGPGTLVGDGGGSEL